MIRSPTESQVSLFFCFFFLLPVVAPHSRLPVRTPRFSLLCLWFGPNGLAPDRAIVLRLDSVGYAPTIVLLRCSFPPLPFAPIGWPSLIRAAPR